MAIVRVFLALAATAFLASPPSGAPRPWSGCGRQGPRAAGWRAAGSSPDFVAMLLCFDKPGGTSLMEPETYLYYIQTKPSRQYRNLWVPYDAGAEQVLLADF